MSSAPEEGPVHERAFHTYESHHIPWYVRGMWIAFWIGLIWYLVVNALPNARNYF